MCTDGISTRPRPRFRRPDIAPALLVGLPIALGAAVRWPLPTEVPTWTAFERALTRRELDSWTLVKALAVLVWLA